MTVSGGFQVETIGDRAFAGCTALKKIMMSASLEFGESYGIAYPGGLRSLGENVFADTALEGSLYLPSYCEVVDASLLSGATGITGIEGYSYGDGFAVPDEAFKGITSLKSVKLNGVISIGTSAFEGCIALKEVELFGNDGTINARAFAGCSAVTQISVDGFTTIAGDAFEGVNALYNYEALEDGTVMLTGYTIVHPNSGDITIPSEYEGKSVSKIGYYAFSGSGISGVTIGNNVQVIEEGAFENCDALTRVQVSDSVTEIGDSAFYGCDALETVSIGNNINTIGDSAFYSCPKLKSVTINNSKLMESIGDSAFYDCTSLTTVTLRNGVKSIGMSAFGNCSALTEFAIPEGVESIGASAFSSTGLRSVVLPDSVTSLGITAFNYCSDLSQVRLSAGLESIGQRTFGSNTSLTSVVIPEGVKTIDSQAFYACDNLEKIVLPASVESVGKNAFMKSDAAENVVLSTYLHKKLLQNSSTDNAFGTAGSYKIYAMAGSTLQCVTDTIQETRIVKLDGENSAAHDALEVSIMREIGAVNAEYMLEQVTVNVPETVVEFSYGILTGDFEGLDDKIASLNWTVAEETVTFELDPTVWSMICFRIKETETSDYIYLITPKLKKKQG